MAILQMEMRYAGPREAIHPRHHPQELRLHPHHHRPRPRRRRQRTTILTPPRTSSTSSPTWASSRSSSGRSTSARNAAPSSTRRSARTRPPSRSSSAGRRSATCSSRAVIPPAELMRPEVAKIIMEFKEPVQRVRGTGHEQDQSPDRRAGLRHPPDRLRPQGRASRPEGAHGRRASTAA